MSGRSEAEQRDELAPVRAHLIDRAEREADAEREAARREAAERLEAARSRARRIIAEARAQGRALGEAESSAARVTARRQARALESAAEYEVYTAVRDGVERGIRALRDAPGYPRLRAALERRARALLGPDAHLVEDARGGVIGTAPDRRVDLSLPSIAARVLDGLDEEVARLWTR